MADQLQHPRGTADVLPDEAELRDALVGTAAQLLGEAGYQHIDTPIFESTELFKRGVGGSTDVVRKEMYTFEDGGGRSMTLRPEGTAGVARAYVQHGMHKLPQPVKLWYHGPFFRYERAQAGRQRQFAQIGAEVLGSDDPLVDAELITLLHRLITAVGGQQIVLKLGSLGSLEARAEYRQLLLDYLRSRESELSEDVRSRIDENPLRAFDAKDPGTQAVMAAAPLLMDHLAGEDAEHFAEVKAMLDVAGIPYEIDKTLVRGLDYYTRTVFEFSSAALGAQSGVGGGGRYDGLVQQIGGPATPGAGWAAGVERLLLARSPEHRSTVKRTPPLHVIVAPGARVAAFQLAHVHPDLATIDLSGRSVKGQLKAAARGAAPVLAIVEPEQVTFRRRGEDEVTVPLADAHAELHRQLAATGTVTFYGDDASDGPAA
ncbi:MAG: histidine--tRNA ligase [Solirubrobacteraceae bacterium]|nr:histidine--tRNA ligase [Solirubrobacteraceae bacterium]